MSADRDIVLTDEFTEALAILGAGQNLFLTGKAGTGKSTLIRHFMASTDRNVLVTAPTGIAALNVDGYTLHRLFSFQSTTSLAEVRAGQYFPGRFSKALKALETLIIDEASMVRADLFDMVVAALEKFGPRPGQPFGGVQVVLVGDLLQLPPVVTEAEKDYFSTHYATPYFFSAESYRREDFPTVALTTVFRQLGDHRLTSLLNAVREGVLMEHAQEELNARHDREFVPPDDEFWLTLAPTNRLVTARNRQRLERLEGDEVVHHARITGDLGAFEHPTDEVLRFKVGAQVMMLSNDPSDRWVNGTLGRITDVGTDGDGDGDVVVEVAFRDGTSADVRPFLWEATQPVVEGGSLTHEVIGTFLQLPFKLAWAITIHKSQGQTLDRLVVDLSGGVFAFGQVYVALSRVTSLEGLVLTRPVLPKDLRTDRRILRFLREATAVAGERRHAAIGMLTVGDEGRMSRPRPVEIAVAFDDGTALSTVVNPQRDLADARDAYGISVTDVLLAPNLAEAWSVLGPILDGATLVGVHTDETLALIDFELKRLKQVVPLPLGIDVAPQLLLPEERAALAAPTAMERAVAALAAHTRLAVEDAGATAFALPDDADTGSTYLLSRDPGSRPPGSVHLPSLTTLVDVSRELSAAVLHGLTATEVQERYRSQVDVDAGLALRGLMAERLKLVASRAASVPADLVERLAHAGALLGVDDLGSLVAAASAGPDIDAVLVPGARVCFTGTAISPEGRVLSKPAIEAIAARAGLEPVPSVTIRRCDALIVAEVGTQSGKARKALELGKPVFSAADFFAWVARR